LENRYGVQLALVYNDKAEVWNNAYSLWTAREVFAEPTLLVNGDTVHPVAVEQTLLEARGPGLLLALDTNKSLGEEEMKVLVDPRGTMQRITKAMDPTTAHGEYIGATLIEPAIGEQLADALEATFTRDPDLYYEDGYQELVDRGVEVTTVPIPADTEWVEVDDHIDLARAKEIVCRY
jgi:choline kinase